MRRQFLLLVSMTVLCVVVFSNHALGQSTGLPADLVMTVGERAPDGSVRLHLAFWDARREVLIPRYSETSASTVVLRPIGWSPDGRYLAVYRIEEIDPVDPTLTGYVGQICVLTRSGDPVTCADARPQQVIGQELADPVQQASWAQNGRQLYFPVTADSGTAIIEVDAQTGSTLREINRVSDPTNGRYGTKLSWSTDLRQMMVGVGDFSRTLDFPVYLMDTDTSASVDLKERLIHLQYLCFGFSPDGSNIVAVVRDTTGNQGLAVVDQQGALIAQVDSHNGLGALRVFCPTWSLEGASFFFMGVAADDELARVFQYKPASDTLSVVYRLPAELDPLTDTRAGEIYQISDTYEGFVAANGLNSTDTDGNGQVVVINPNGESLAIVGDYLFSQDAIWIPPVSIYRAIQNGHQVHIERALSAGIDTFDSPPRGDGWTVVGRTHGSGTDGTLMALVVFDDVPYAAIQHATKGCIVATPESLDPVRHGATRKVEIVEEGVAVRCAGDWSGFTP